MPTAADFLARQRQPRGGIALNRAAPINKLLRQAALYRDPSGYDYASGKIVTWPVTTDLKYGVSQAGAAALVNGGWGTSSDRHKFNPSAFSADDVPATLRFVFQLQTGALAAGIEALYRSESAANAAVYISTAGKIEPYAGSFGATSTASLSENTYYDVAITKVAGSATGSIYINGALDSTIASFPGSLGLTNIGVWGDAFNQHMQGAFYLFQAWERILDAAEIAQLYADPYKSWRPIPRPLVGVVAAGGTITPWPLFQRMVA